MGTDRPTVILYSKPGCHLCEGLRDKLNTILETSDPPLFQLEERNINTRKTWFAAYQFEVPVLAIAGVDGYGDQPLPRPSPRAPVVRIEQMLRQHLGSN